MSDDGKVVLQANKSTNVILAIHELYHVSLQEATDIYYRSDTSDFMERGVADLQCRSDKYLATVIWDEHNESQKGKEPISLSA